MIIPSNREQSPAGFVVTDRDHSRHFGLLFVNFHMTPAKQGCCPSALDTLILQSLTDQTSPLQIFPTSPVLCEILTNELFCKSKLSVDNVRGDQYKYYNYHQKKKKT